MVNTFSFIFYLKQPIYHKKGPVPNYLRITVDSKRAEISIKREADPNNWNSKTGRLDGNNKS